MTTSDLEFQQATRKMLRPETSCAPKQRHEGSFVDHKAGPGGATHHGIFLRFLRAAGEIAAHDADGDGHLDADDIKALFRDQAVARCKNEFDKAQKLRAGQ